MQSIDLAGRWRLVRCSTGETVPAQVPGDTHSALLAAGKIPDPYWGTNELQVQEIGREDWAYERELDVEASLLEAARVELSFECLDTIAEVFVNRKSVGRADNMFARWTFDVKRALRAGRNTVRVQFTSAENAAAAMARKLPYPVPHVMNPVQSPHRNLVRKVQCHAGWDWGPCLMVAGITGAATLDAWSQERIDYVYTEQKHSRGKVVVRVFVECQAGRAAGEDLQVTVGSASAQKRVQLSPGTNCPWVDVTVEKPELWWPNGYGEPRLYDLRVRLGGLEATRQIGLRTLELVNKEDRNGLSMVFRVNGVEIFCKGANWIPPDALPQRESPSRLEHLLESARKANMNMLRVWGGGRYETDAFYSLCDSKGILIWHDMMFSCALYPATPAFLANVEREIRHQVKRLRHHACIALWCGNNEDVGALTWFPESKKNRDRYIVDYDRLNEGVIGRVVDECDPTRTFWPSSPSAGRGDYSDNWHDDRRGDMHYWSVWHEGKPFGAYYDVAPRFCSEFGYQSFPSVRTIRTYADPEDFNVTSPVMEHHQRHPRGNSAITEMFTRYFRVPEGFENFVYLSQVQQAMAIKTAVEYWRSLRPSCMGTLYWQLNDNWPVCSWSSIEYDGSWKLLHYAARRFFSPLLLCAWIKDGQVQVVLVNDLPSDVRATAMVSVLGFDGTSLRREKMDVRAAAGTARRLKSWALAELAPKPEAAFIHLELQNEHGTSFNELFLAEPKRARLAAARVTVDAAPARGGAFAVRLTTDAPAFHVSLETGEIRAELSDNDLTLLPGSPRTVELQPSPATTVEKLRKSLSVRHLRDTYR
jgi:beta-mannosidase